ncbi:hypothetical protein REPUB_Repub04eG0223400 [Reevesia pubescens]
MFQLLLISFFFTLLLSNPSPSLSQQDQSFSFSDLPWLPTQNKILVSGNNIFAAGFMPILSSQNLYSFSVWYYNLSRNSTIVWSANANSPVTSNSALVISNTGQLRLINFSGQNLLPLSFDYPTDTILPNQTMKANGTAIHSKNDKFSFQDSKSLVFNSSQYWSHDNAFQRLEASGRVVQDNGATLVSSDFGEPTGYVD